MLGSAMAQYAIAIAPYTTYPFNAFNTACIVVLASPNNMRVFSSTNKGLPTPAYPDAMLRLSS
jgi:hypothetical protein